MSVKPTLRVASAFDIFCGIIGTEMQKPSATLFLFLLVFLSGLFRTKTTSPDLNVKFGLKKRRRRRISTILNFAFNYSSSVFCSFMKSHILATDRKSLILIHFWRENLLNDFVVAFALLVV